MNFPSKIEQLIKDKKYDLDTFGMSGSKIMIFDDMVLKVQPESEETENEYRIMKWLRGKVPVPEVMHYEKEEGMAYLLMTRVQGKMTCDDAYMQNPDMLLHVVTEGLKQLWSIDISDCPCDNSLDKKLTAARYNVEHGLVDMDNVEPETFGEGGFRDPEELLQWLFTHRPEEEPVLSHGDYCLPNVFADGNKISGLIDLGKTGISDKWLDIAICYRSLKHNFDGVYSGVAYASFNPTVFFEKLETEPDWEKIRYYILLDELF